MPGTEQAPIDLKQHKNIHWRHTYKHISEDTQATGNNSLGSMWCDAWETVWGTTVLWDFTNLFEYCIL